MERQLGSWAGATIFFTVRRQQDLGLDTSCWIRMEKGDGSREHGSEFSTLGRGHGKETSNRNGTAVSQNFGIERVELN